MPRAPRPTRSACQLFVLDDPSEVHVRDEERPGARHAHMPELSVRLIGPPRPQHEPGHNTAGGLLDHQERRGVAILHDEHAVEANRLGRVDLEPCGLHRMPRVPLAAMEEGVLGQPASRRRGRGILPGCRRRCQQREQRTESKDRGHAEVFITRRHRT